MKKSKGPLKIVDTAAGKYLVRDFRPPIQLRTSPRKKKNKLKKEIKRLDENHLSNKVPKSKKKSRAESVKKQLNFQDDISDEDQDQNSILFVISNESQDNQLNEDDLTNSKCKLVHKFTEKSFAKIELILVFVLLIRKQIVH